jgi:replicative DNA helicase
MTALPPDPLARIQPHNLDAEQELLGAILCNNQALDSVSSFLKAGHFFHEAHRRIFDACVTLIGRGEVANPVTLKTFFEADEVIAKAGGTVYLARLAAAATTIVNAVDYGRVIWDLAIRRELIAIAEKASAAAYDPKVDDAAETLLRQIETQVQDLADSGGRELEPIDLHAAMRAGAEAAERALKGEHVGLPTGIARLDELYSGMAPGDLVILAGRPGMGKSAVAQVIAFNVAVASTEEKPAGVLFFQQEMSGEQMGQRGLAWASGVPYDDMRKGRVPAEKFSKFVDAEGRAKRLHFGIVDRADLRPSDIRAAARRWKRRRPLSLVVVDYLQITKPDRIYQGNKVAEITEISASFKRLARELGVPVIVLSQLSRDLEKRDEKRPQLSDLRDSGAIEQDADAVIFVYRPEYYLERAEPKEGSPKHVEWMAELESVRGVMEIIVAKQRMGPIGVARVHFDAARNRIKPLDDGDDRQGSMV